MYAYMLATVGMYQPEPRMGITRPGARTRTRTEWGVASAALSPGYDALGRTCPFLARADAAEKRRPSEREPSASTTTRRASDEKAEFAIGQLQRRRGFRDEGTESTICSPLVACVTVILEQVSWCGCHGGVISQQRAGATC